MARAVEVRRRRRGGDCTMVEGGVERREEGNVLEEWKVRAG